MEIAWQTRTDATRGGLCFLDSDRFEYLCFSCEVELPGRELWEAIQSIEELPPEEELWLDDDPLDLMDELRGELFAEHGNVLAITWGLCDYCRDHYITLWLTADRLWLKREFRNIPTRIARQRSYRGVSNWFSYEDEFRSLIRPKLVFCRPAYPGERPSLDRYWPEDQNYQGVAPYADRFVRVIPQRFNSGLASRRLSAAVVRRIIALKEEGHSQRTISKIIGCSESSVSRKIRGQFELTSDMR